MTLDDVYNQLVAQYALLEVALQAIFDRLTQVTENLYYGLGQGDTSGDGWYLGLLEAANPVESTQAFGIMFAVIAAASVGTFFAVVVSYFRGR